MTHAQLVNLVPQCFLIHPVGSSASEISIISFIYSLGTKNFTFKKEEKKKE